MLQRIYHRSISIANRSLKSTIRSNIINRARFSTAIVQHRDTDNNNPDTPFAFTPANQAKIKTILAKFPDNYKQSAVMPLLTLAQEQHQNWIPLSAMNLIADMLEMPRIRVYEVVTFYSMYNREKLGKYHIQLCGTTPCMLCGSQKLAETLQKHLGIAAGEISNDGLFTWTEVECLGACANAPMIQINNHEFYENLTAESLIKLVDDLRAGKSIKVGPQNGQRVAEGIQGKTSLFNISKPVCRDLDQLAKDVQVEKDKAAAAAAAPKPATPAAPAAPKP